MMTDTWTWATVTQASPLRIKVDGDTSELDATTDDLVGSLAVDDRVRVHLHSDGIIVTGIQGGAGDGQLPERLRVLAKDISGLNLNDYMETGWYRGKNVINAPSTNWYYFEVIQHSPDWVYQRATGYGPVSSHTDKSWQRWKSNGTWTAWEQINNVPFAEQVGTITISGNGTTASDATLTFQAGLFSVAPIVICGNADHSTIALVGSALSITATSCSIRLYRADGGVYSSSYTIPWRAAQMASGAAAGYVGG